MTRRAEPTQLALDFGVTAEQACIMCHLSANCGECGQELRYNITITKITWYEPNEWEDIAYLVNKADIKEINKHLANLDYENIRLI